MSFDLDLYMYAGRWYEIGRSPNPWQPSEACAKSYVDYYVDDKTSLNPPELDIINHCFTKDGRPTKTSKAHARVSTIPNVLITKWEMSPEEDEMLIFDTDYTTYAIEGSMPKSGGNPYLWILSRTPKMCSHQLEQILEKMVQMKLDISDVKILFDTKRFCLGDLRYNTVR